MLCTHAQQCVPGIAGPWLTCPGPSGQIYTPPHPRTEENKISSYFFQKKTKFAQRAGWIGRRSGSNQILSAGSEDLAPKYSEPLPSLPDSFTKSGRIEIERNPLSLQFSNLAFHDATYGMWRCCNFLQTQRTVRRCI